MEFVKLRELLINDTKNPEYDVGISTKSEFLEFNILNKIPFINEKKQLSIIASRPGMGKSTFMLQLATTCALIGNLPCYIFSLKETKEEIGCFKGNLTVNKTDDMIKQEKVLEFANSVNGYYWYLDGYEYAYIYTEIVEEYGEVLSRSKFHFAKTDVEDTLNLFSVKGENYTPEYLREGFADPDDTIFYETYLMKDDAYLITGNLKHFPSEPRIVSPADIIHIISLLEKANNHILSEPQAEYISDTKKIKLQRAWEAIERMRASAAANGIADMSMEEIDEEIRLARENRKA